MIGPGARQPLCDRNPNTGRRSVTGSFLWRRARPALVRRRLKVRTLMVNQARALVEGTAYRSASPHLTRLETGGPAAE